MKRDIDLARKLLLDIEQRGADCSVSILPSGVNHDAEERIRYHLRLLIDAGYLKEVDRAANGVPCVRLTDQGHELIELSRSEELWRRAKWSCRQRTGGLSLAVVRGLLVRHAFRAASLRRRRRVSNMTYVTAMPYARDERSLVGEPWMDGDVDVWHGAPQHDPPYVRVRPTRREGWRYNGYGYGLNGDRGHAYLATGELPDYLI